MSAGTKDIGELVNGLVAANKPEAFGKATNPDATNFLKNLKYHYGAISNDNEVAKITELLDADRQAAYLGSKIDVTKLSAEDLKRYAGDWRAKLNEAAQTGVITQEDFQERSNAIRGGLSEVYNKIDTAIIRARKEPRRAARSAISSAPAEKFIATMTHMADVAKQKLGDYIRLWTEPRTQGAAEAQYITGLRYAGNGAH